jgi:glycosyltransferase involved in cell wall biosynthesis
VPRVYWPPLRALFVNQGAIASRASREGGVRGHTATESALRIGVEGAGDVSARFARMGPWALGARALARPVPGLDRRDLDLHVPRWHLVESVRGRGFIAARLAASAVDVLHVTSHTPALLVADVMRRVPTFLAVDVPIWEWHAMGIWRPVARHSRAALWPSLALERRAFEDAAGVIAFSDWAAAAVRRTAPGARVFTICPGVDTARLRPATKLARTRARVLFVGGRFAEKGGRDLLDALGEDLDRSVELDVVTGDPLPERPGVRVHRLGREDPRLLALYQQADVMCLPTRGDSLGWALVEAMACGTPVISTPVGAIPELLDEGRRGLLVEPGDPRALRAAIRQLLDDEALRGQLAGRALVAVAERFDARVQGRKLVGVMREAVDASRSRPGHPASDDGAARRGERELRPDREVDGAVE